MPIARKNRAKSRTAFRPLGALENMEQRLMFTLPAINAAAAIVTTGDGDVIGEHNADEQRHMASTTKIMTALVAIEKSASGNPSGLSLEDEVEVGWYAGNVNVGGFGNGRFDPGDVASLKDMLFATMLRSDNEAAHAVAEHISIHQPDSAYSEVSNNLIDGSGLVSEFADLMNTRAEELGMSNTSFRTPDGAQYVQETFPAISTHYTTARDMAILAKAAMANPTLKEIVSTFQTNIIVNTQSDTATNGNRLIWPTSTERYPGAEGVKTGDTPVAGRCLVSQATLLGKTVTVVVLGADTNVDMYKDTHALLNHGFEEEYDFIVDVGNREVQTNLATYDVDAKLLTITGTSAADSLSLTQQNGMLRVELNGSAEEFPVADLDNVVVELQDGADVVTASGSLSGFELEIEGGDGHDTLELGASMILGTITGDDAGTIANVATGEISHTFSNFERLDPDDHRDQAHIARRISLARGCTCDHDVEWGGFMHSAEDEDWFRFEAGTGSLVMSLHSGGETTSDTTLELWNLSDRDNPTLFGSVDADAAAAAISVEAGEYGFRVGDGQKFSRYEITATIPSAPLTWRDLFGLPTRPENRWETMPTRFDRPGIGPDPLPIKFMDRVVAPAILQPTVTRAMSNTGVRVAEQSAVDATRQITAESVMDRAQHSAAPRQARHGTEDTSRTPVQIARVSTLTEDYPIAVDQTLATEMPAAGRNMAAPSVSIAWLMF